MVDQKNSKKWIDIQTNLFVIQKGLRGKAISS